MIEFIIFEFMTQFEGVAGTKIPTFNYILCLKISSFYSCGHYNKPSTFKLFKIVSRLKVKKMRHSSLKLYFHPPDTSA